MPHKCGDSENGLQGSQDAFISTGVLTTCLGPPVLQGSVGAAVVGLGGGDSHSEMGGLILGGKTRTNQAQTGLSWPPCIFPRVLKVFI